MATQVLELGAIVADKTGQVYFVPVLLLLLEILVWSGAASAA